VPGHWQCVAAFAAYEGLMLYRCRFGHRVPLGNGLIPLRFGGVYYSARVWLNGVLLGEHEGYFAPFEFDVTGILADGENELLVEVHSPEEAEENARVTIGGVWVRWDGLGPNLNPGGIFRDVPLSPAGRFAFEPWDPRPTTRDAGKLTWSSTPGEDCGPSWSVRNVL
jgi:beta-mannosidase